LMQWEEIESLAFSIDIPNIETLLIGDGKRSERRNQSKDEKKKQTCTQCHEDCV